MMGLLTYLREDGPRGPSVPVAIFRGLLTGGLLSGGLMPGTGVTDSDARVIVLADQKWVKSLISCVHLRGA